MFIGFSIVLLLIDLQSTVNVKTNSVRLLSVGLELDDGVQLKLDEQNLGQGARFSTCLPAGWLVQVSFPAVATDAIKKAEKLGITATRNGEVPTFTVSLNWFTSALNSVAELAK